MNQATYRGPNNLYNNSSSSGGGGGGGGFGFGSMRTGAFPTNQASAVNLSSANSSAGKPYRVAIRTIKEKTLDGAASTSEALSTLKSFPSPSANSVGGSSSERLLSHLPPNFCDVWHAKVCNSQFQLGEMVGASMAQGCGLYVVDCGYEEESVGVNDDMLSHYIRRSAFVPQPQMRSLIGSGGLGGLGPSFGIGDEDGGGGGAGGGGSSLSQSARLNSGKSTSSKKDAASSSCQSHLYVPSPSDGIAVAFVAKLLSERPNHTIQFSFFAMSAVDRPVTDLLLPLMPVSHAARVAGTMDEKQSGTLSSLLIDSVERFVTVLENITSSNTFRLARPRLSFGMVFKSHGVPHVMLLLNQHHQRLAIATLEGQMDSLPPELQDRLREADAANNRIGMSSNGLGPSSLGGGRQTNGFASVLDPTRQNGVADFYGSGSRIMHDPPPTSSDTNTNTRIVLNDSNAFGDNGGGGASSLGTLFDNGQHQHQQQPVNYELLKATQQRRLLAVSVLAHIRRTMALHYMKEQRVEYFKPMYVVRIGADQKGDDPLGMIPFVLARGSPNILLGADGADYRVLMRQYGGGGGAAMLPASASGVGGSGAGDSSPWNGGGGAGGVLDQHQYAMLMAGLTPQQQQAQRERTLQHQQRQYHQELLHHQQQLQAAARNAGLGGSVLMFRPPMAPPTESNLFGNLKNNSAFDDGIGNGGGNGNGAASPLATQRALFQNDPAIRQFNANFLNNEATNPTMMLVPDAALPPQMRLGAGNGGLPQQRFQHQAPFVASGGGGAGGAAASPFHAGMSMGGYHHDGLFNNNNVNSVHGAMPHLSRMAQNPTQVPYALLQSPSNHPSSASASDNDAAKRKKKAEADRFIAEFETIRQEKGETVDSAMFRSDNGIVAGADGEPLQQPKNGGGRGDADGVSGAARGPLAASVFAPPAVKPFIVTDATISDTFEYLEKEKHVCRNAHRELQKDIHNVLMTIEDVTRKHEQTRDALKRKRGEMARVVKELEGGKHRSAQVEAMLTTLEKDIQSAKEAIALEEKNKTSTAQEDAEREKERQTKRAAHLEKLHGMIEEHRARMFQQAQVAANKEEELRSALSSLKTAIDTANVAARRELIAINGEINLASAGVEERAVEIRNWSEKVSEGNVKRRELESAIAELRAVVEEESRINASRDKQRLETEGVQTNIAFLERGLAAYDHFMTAEANAIAKEVGSIVGGGGGGNNNNVLSLPPLASHASQTQNKAGSSTPSQLSLGHGGGGGGGFRLSATPSNASFGANYAAGDRDNNILDDALGAATAAAIATSTSRNMSHNSNAFTPEDAAIVSGRLDGLFKLRRSAATLKVQTVKQKRTLLLKRARANKYRLLVLVEEHEAAARQIIFNQYAESFADEIANVFPESYAKAFRTFEMMAADANSNNIACSDANNNGGWGGGGGNNTPRSALRGGGTSPNITSQQQQQRRIRFVDIDTDLASATHRLQTLQREVQAKVRQRLELVTQLEVARNETALMAVDTETAKMEEAIRQEVEGVERLRAAQKVAFEQQEEELARRRRVYMSMFMDFFPQMKKELEHFEATSMLKRSNNNSDGGGPAISSSSSFRRINSLQNGQQQRPLSTRTADATRAIINAAVGPKQQQQNNNNNKDDKNNDNGNNANGRDLPHYLADTVSFTARRRLSAFSSSNAAQQQPSQAANGLNTSTASSSAFANPNTNNTHGLPPLITTRAETVRSNSTVVASGGDHERGGGNGRLLRGGAGAGAGGGEMMMSSSSFDTQHERDALAMIEGDVDADVNAEGHLSFSDRLRAEATNRFAAIALKHLHGAHTRQGTNPIGISGQASITAEHGDAACQLYMVFREKLDASKQLQAAVEEKVELATEAEKKVNSLGEKVASIRARLGALSEQREQFEMEKKRHSKALQEASARVFDDDLASQSQLSEQREAHAVTVRELKRQLEAVNSLCEGVRSEVAMGERDLRRLKEEVVALSSEVDALPELQQKRDMLKTEIALIESEQQFGLTQWSGEGGGGDGDGDDGEEERATMPTRRMTTRSSLSTLTAGTITTANNNNGNGGGGGGSTHQDAAALLRYTPSTKFSNASSSTMLATASSSSLPPSHHREHKPNRRAALEAQFQPKSELMLFTPAEIAEAAAAEEGDGGGEEEDTENEKMRLRGEEVRSNGTAPPSFHSSQREVGGGGHDDDGVEEAGAAQDHLGARKASSVATTMVDASNKQRLADGKAPTSSSSASSRLPKSIQERIQKHKERQLLEQRRQRELQKQIEALQIQDHCDQPPSMPPSDDDDDGDGDADSTYESRNPFAQTAAGGDASATMPSTLSPPRASRDPRAELSEILKQTPQALMRTSAPRPPPSSLSDASSVASRRQAVNNKEDGKEGKRNTNTNNNMTSLEKLLSRLEHSEARSDRRLAAADRFLQENAGALSEIPIDVIAAVSGGGVDGVGNATNDSFGQFLEGSMRSDDTMPSESGSAQHHNHHNHAAMRQEMLAVLQAQQRESFARGIDYHASPKRKRLMQEGGGDEGEDESAARTTQAQPSPEPVSKYAALREVLAQHIAGLSAEM